jgi:hypothetical protein
VILGVSPSSSCWSCNLLREEFLSAHIHSPPLWSPNRSFREFESGRSEPSNNWRTRAGRSSDHLGRSAWRGGALCDSGAHAPLGATQRRTTRWSSRVGRAARCELEPAFLSCAAICGCCDDDTFVARGGDDEDDPNMSLQSTVAMATSPLHDGSSDGSSLEEMPRSPAFRLLMRFSFRSCSLCCALRAARCLSAAAFFRLKIASSGRGALTGTRCAHLNSSNKKAEESVGVEGL